MAYSSPGRYKGGIWLVRSPRGGFSFSDRANLPSGRGYQYYWLGSTYSQASSRLTGAVDALKSAPGLTGFDESLPLIGGINRSIINAIQGPQRVKNINRLDQQLQQAFAQQPTSNAPTPATQPQETSPGLTGGLGGGLFQSIGDSINSTANFLAFIAWIFHPRNIARAVEFVAGFALMIFGLHAAMQARGERAEGFSTSESVITRSGLGRVAAALGAAARGKDRRVRAAPHRERREAPRRRAERQERHLRTREQRESRLAEQQKRRIHRQGSY